MPATPLTTAATREMPHPATPSGTSRRFRPSTYPRPSSVRETPLRETQTIPLDVRNDTSERAVPSPMPILSARLRRDILRFSRSRIMR